MIPEKELSFISLWATFNQSIVAHIQNLWIHSGPTVKEISFSRSVWVKESLIIAYDWCFLLVEAPIDAWDTIIVSFGQESFGLDKSTSRPKDRMHIFQFLFPVGIGRRETVFLGDLGIVGHQEESSVPQPIQMLWEVSCISSYGRPIVCDHEEMSRIPNLPVDAGRFGIYGACFWILQESRFYRMHHIWFLGRRAEAANRNQSLTTGATFRDL